MEHKCKRCLLLESAEADMLETIKEKINKLPIEDKCDEEAYKERLEECKKCDNLISGVCMKCGCYVEFRAAFKKQKCPDVAVRKW